MYVDVSHVRQAGKTYTRYLLRESYRDDGKVKHRTIANLSGCSAAEIEAIRLALRHKDNLSTLGTNPSEIVIKQGLSYGASMLSMRWHAPWVLSRRSAPRVMDCWRCGSHCPRHRSGIAAFGCGWRRLMRPKKSLD